MSQTLTLAAGILDIGFAVFHMLFWKLFGWPERLRPSGRLNAAITQTMNCVLILVFLLYGAALIWNGATAQPTPRVLLLCGVAFGLLRGALQPLLFGLQGTGSIGIFVVICLTTLVHGAAALP